MYVRMLSFYVIRVNFNMDCWYGWNHQNTTWTSIQTSHLLEWVIVRVRVIWTTVLDVNKILGCDDNAQQRIIKLRTKWEQDIGLRQARDKEFMTTVSKEQLQASKVMRTTGGLRWCTGLVPCTREYSSTSTRVSRIPGYPHSGEMHESTTLQDSSVTDEVSG